MILELIKSAAFLLALSLLQGFIIRFFRQHMTVAQVLSGMLFGGICVIGMMLPIEVIPGVIFDPRSVVLSMAGLFGGPIVAVVSAAIAGGYRLWLGGGGVYVGVAVVIACSALGLAYRYGVRRNWLSVGVRQLLAFGLLVHVVEVMLFTQLPEDAVQQVMDTVALPLILTFSPATVFLGMLLKDIENRTKTEAALVESEGRLSLHLQNTPLAAISWDENFCCTQWNKAAERIFGYTAEEALGKHAMDLVIPENIKSEIDKIYQLLMSQKGGTRNINENLTKDGRIIICEWYNTSILDQHGKPIGVVSLAEDVTDKKHAEEEMKLKNLLLMTQQEASIDGILAVDANGKVISMNQRFVDIWGIPTDVRKSMSDEAFLQCVLDKLKDPDRFMERVSFLYNHPDETSSEEVELKDGRILDRYSAPMMGADSHYYGRLWMFRDITARKESEELIWHQANFDSLTGLTNRQMLHDRLLQEIKHAHRAGQRIALLYLDLDLFKDINDTLGHDTGDTLLIETAKRLTACVREMDTVSRLGGDEFTILIGDLDEPGSAERIAKNVLGRLAEPFILGDETVYVSASIGITFYPDDALDADELLRNADQAMYAAKARGRNCFQYFTTSMQQAAATRMSMIKDLRAALPDSQFRLYYQPIVELGSGQICKAEALIRWQHPLRGLVSPAEFISVAEDTGMIVEIGDWVFREAARQAAAWRTSIHPDFQITVNTSPVQYRHAALNVSEWLEHLQEIGLSGQAIVVEITEGLLMGADAMIADKLLTFRDAGIQVSLDDFGTGYSSLSYLKKFDIDYLKIDQSFVRHLEPGSDDMALCEAIIVMAHKLGLKVVAEGIETSAHRDLLAAVGCDYGQGYLFSRPVTAEDFASLIRAD